MPAFNYIALDTHGSKQKGVLQGDSPRQIRQQLRDQGLTPLTVNAVAEKTTTNAKRSFRGKRLSKPELALITRQLATLLSAGIPIAEALLAVAEQTDKQQQKSIIMGVRAKVLEGHTLAAGMETFPRAFPQIYRASVFAGEQSGHLDRILNRLADYTEKQHQIQQKVRQALIYPTLMTAVSVMIIIFLLIFVVPKITTVFVQSGQQLPLLTDILLFISHVTKAYGLYALIILVLASFGIHWLLKKPKPRNAWQSFLMRIPVLGNAIKVINSARFARTFGILYSASVPVLEAMQAASQLIKPLPMRTAVEAAIGEVREGTSIHQSLKSTGYFDPMTIHLIASGEASGQLENMLEKAADNQDHNVSVLIENSLTLFEPLLIMLMGAIVLFIVLAIMLPIFQLDVIAGQN